MIVPLIIINAEMMSNAFDCTAPVVQLAMSNIEPKYTSPMPILFNIIDLLTFIFIVIHSCS